MKKVRVILLAVLLVLACVGCSGNADSTDKENDANGTNNGDGETQATAVTMRLEKSEGSVAVSDENGKEQELREKLPLFSGYGIQTQAESFSWFNLDDTKLAKMDENSEASIEKEDKNLKLLVDKGSLYFNITEPLEDDESLEIRTSSMTVGIRGTSGWVDAETETLYIIHGTVICEAIESGEQVEVSEWTSAHLMEDGTFELIYYFNPMDIPVFVWDEMDEDSFAELGLSSNRDDLFAVREPDPEPEEVEEPDFDLTGKDTAYRSGYNSIYAQNGSSIYELEYYDGLLTTAYLDDEEGKGGWGGDIGISIKGCPFYGMTVEEAAEELRNQGYSVTIY